MKTRCSGSRGFTLIELMIVVAVLAILAAIAYPSYAEFTRRSNRNAAQSLLMDLAQRQQQYFTQQRAFAGSLTSLDVTVPADVARFYTIAIDVSAGPPPSFTLTATPKTGTTQASDSTLTLDSTGAKTPSGKW
jgi:type IV pilus assembly protein PilE